MSELFITALAVTWLLLWLVCWLGWQLLRQNGRMLLRLDELEKRLDTLRLPDPVAWITLGPDLS